MDTDTTFMRAAIKQAQKAYEKSEVPIGCVIVHDGKIIARGYNRRNTDKSTLAHAEITAIRKAAKKLGDWRIEDCTLDVTLEPCPMCAGAVMWANIRRVYYGCTISDTDKKGFRDKQFYSDDTDISEELDRSECLKVFREYQGIGDRKLY